MAKNKKLNQPPVDADFAKFLDIYNKDGARSAMFATVKKKEEEKKAPSKPLKDFLEPPKPVYDFTKTPEENETLQKGGRLLDIKKAPLPTADELLKSMKSQPKSEYVRPDIQQANVIQSQAQQNFEQAKQTPIGRGLLKPALGFGAGLAQGTGIDSMLKMGGYNQLSGQLEEARSEAPISSVLGFAGGLLLPGMGATKLASGLLKPALGGAGKIASATAVETVAGAGLGATYNALAGKNPLMGAAEWGGGAALGTPAIMGIGKGVGAARNITRDYKNIGNILDDALPTPSNFDAPKQSVDDIYRSARQEVTDKLPKQTLLPEGRPTAQKAIEMPTPELLKTTPPKVGAGFQKETPFVAYKGELSQPKVVARNFDADIKPVELPKVDGGINSPNGTKTPLKTNVVRGADTNVGGKQQQFKTATTLSGNQKISQTKTNTIRRTTEMTEESKKYLPDKEFGYEPQTTAEWQDAATSNFTKNKQSIVDDLLSDNPTDGGRKTFEAAMVVKEAEAEAIKTGRFDKLLSYTKKYAEKLRENARALKAHDLAWEKNPTVGNTIAKAQRIIDNTQEQVLKSSPKLKAKLDGELKALKQTIQDAVKEATGETMAKLRLNLQLFAKVKPDSLQSLIGKHFSTDPLKRGELIDEILSKFNLTREEAGDLANTINKIFDVKFQKSSENYLKRLLKSDKKQDATLEKVMKLIRAGAYDDVNISNALKEKYGLPVLTSDEAKKLAGMVDELNKMAKDSEEYQIKLAKIRNVIESKQKASIPEIYNSLVSTSLLGNVKTQVANVGGNTVEASLELTGNTLVSPWVDKIIKKVAEKYIPEYKSMRTASLPSIKTLWKGFKDGARITIEDSLGGLQFKELKNISQYERIKRIMGAIWEAEPIRRNLTGIVDDKFKLGRRLYVPKEIVINGKRVPIASELSNIIRITENIVKSVGQFGDNIFSKPYYDDVLNQIKKANKLTEVTDEMKEVAVQVAKERTYADMNLLSMAAEGLRNLPEIAYRNFGNRAPESLRPLLKKSADALQIYFNSMGRFGFTTANLLKRGLEYSPLGLVEGLAKLGYGIRTGKLTPLQQRNIVDLLTRGIMGTAVIAPTAATLYKSGNLTTKEKEDYQAERLKTESQLLPYSLKIGNKYTTIDWMQPLSYSMLAVGEFMKGSKEDKNYYDAIVSGLENTFNVYGEQPFAQSLARLSGKYSSPDEGVGERVVASALEPVKQLVPTVLGQAGAYTDDNKREMYSPSFWEKNLINPIKNKIPGVRESLPKKVGLLGDTQKEYYGKNNLFNTFVARWRTGEYKPNPVEKEMIELYDKTKNVDVIPAYAPKKIEYNGKKFMLTGAERSEYQRNLGKYVSEMVGELIEDPMYIGLENPEDKVGPIKSIITNSKEYAKDLYLEQKNVEIVNSSKKASKIKVPKASKKGRY